MRVLPKVERQRQGRVRVTRIHRSGPAWRRRLWVAAGLLCASVLAGQQSSQFQGSVPAGSASDTPLALKLDDAIQRGLQTNLGLLVRDTTSQTVRAERIRALSVLMPQVTGTVQETDE